MRKYYLVTTEHLKVGLWFRDESDFRAGMNFVAIQAYESKVTVLAFILMSNHLHFVVEGRWADVKAFIDGIKSRYSKYLNHKYGTSEFLRRNKVTIEEVSTLNEGLEKAIAYTQMNCVAANICSHPSQYPWGRARCSSTRRSVPGSLWGACRSAPGSGCFIAVKRICLPIGWSPRRGISSLSRMWRWALWSVAIAGPAG